MSTKAIPGPGLPPSPTLPPGNGFSRASKLALGARGRTTPSSTKHPAKVVVSVSAVDSQLISLLESNVEKSKFEGDL